MKFAHDYELYLSVMCGDQDALKEADQRAMEAASKEDHLHLTSASQEPR